MRPKLNIGYDFDSCLPCKWWDNKTRIEFIQRRIIVFSILYYNMDESILTDQEFDAASHQLVKLMEDTPKSVLEKTRYWYCMYDFDGSTGFYLYSRLTPSDAEQLNNLAGWIRREYRKGDNSKGTGKQAKR
mgnify:FL=1